MENFCVGLESSSSTEFHDRIACLQIEVELWSDRFPVYRRDLEIPHTSLCVHTKVPDDECPSYSSPVTVQILMSALSVPTTIVQIYAACFRRNSTKGLAYNFSSSSTAIRNSDECCISSVIRAVQPSHSAALNHFLLRKTISKIMRSA